MNPSEMLKEAKKLIEDPNRWMKGAFAMLKNGKKIGNDRDVCVPGNHQIMCYCAVGAYIRTCNDEAWGDSPGYLYLNRAAEGYFGIITFNDFPRTTHTDVMDMYDKAIALAEAEEVNG